MEKDILKVLQNFANSGSWDIVKENIFFPLIDSVKDVSRPFKIGDKEIEPEKAYLAKVLTTQKLNEIVETLDRLQSGKGKIEDIDFE